MNSSRIFIGGLSGGTTYSGLWKQAYTILTEKINIALSKITTEIDFTVISTGGTWAEHVPVTLWNKKKIPNLEIVTPMPFIDTQTGFDENYSNLKQQAKAINFNHKKFTNIIQKNTFEEIAYALETGAKKKINNLYHTLDSCDAFIIASFGKKEAVKPGIESEIVNYCKSKNKQIIWHIDMNTGHLHQTVTTTTNNLNKSEQKSKKNYEHM